MNKIHKKQMEGNIKCANQSNQKDSNTERIILTTASMGWSRTNMYIQIKNRTDKYTK